MKQKRLLGEIEKGTVIDHIPPDVCFKVSRMLEPFNDLVVVVNRFPSKKMGEKAVIKIQKKMLTKQELSKIALLAPQATVNVIQNHTILEKYKVKLPNHLENVITCINPNCISHQHTKTFFHVLKKKPLEVRCHYCELVIEKGELVIL